MSPELWKSFSTPFWLGLLPHCEVVLIQAQLMNPPTNSRILFYKHSRSRKQWSVPAVWVGVCWD